MMCPLIEASEVANCNRKMQLYSNNIKVYATELDVTARTKYNSNRI